MRILSFFIALFPLFISSLSFSLPSAFVTEMLQKQYATNKILVYIQDLYNSGENYLYDPNGLMYEYFAPGSLIKPFSLIALSRVTHIDPTRIIHCGGNNKDTPYEERCWLGKGHGNLNLIGAIAHSCNFYFYTIMKNCPYNVFIKTLRNFGWIHGEKGFVRRYLDTKDQNMAKIGRQYFLQNRPVDIITAYRHLFNKDIPFDSEIRYTIYRGMRLSFKEGTASKSRKALGLSKNFPLITKTGTGVYVYHKNYNIHKTNGFFVALYQQHILLFAMIVDGTGTEDASLLGLKVMRLLYK